MLPKTAGQEGQKASYMHMPRSNTCILRGHEICKPYNKSLVKLTLTPKVQTEKLFARKKEKVKEMENEKYIRQRLCVRERVDHPEA